jgi:hypothetical protein
VDLREQDGYQFLMGSKDFIPDEQEARFRLLVGSEEFVAEQLTQLQQAPLRTTLYQNYPNPFNPATVIRYDLAQAARVRLRIYDVRGGLVKTLLAGHGEPGGHEVAWRGRNERGERVSSGVYFCRLETDGGHRETRKLLLVK